MFGHGEFVIESGYPHILYRVMWSTEHESGVLPIDGGQAEVINNDELESFAIPAAMV
jgi:hypothetical protein